MIPKSLHQSWIELAEQGADRAAAVVRYDFGGVLTEGSHAGTAFAGRIEYDVSTPPSERHCSFAIYEEWPAPIVTVAIGGQILTAEGAAVYDGIHDGCSSHFDFVTMFGTGAFDGQDDHGFFELLFASEDAATLDGIAMPAAAHLALMPVKQMSFGTKAPGNVISRGELTLHSAG